MNVAVSSFIYDKQNKQRKKKVQSDKNKGGV